MCTSLLYVDAHNRPYVGRTLELSIDLPYLVARFPVHTALKSTPEDYPALEWSSKYAFWAVTMPATVPQPGTAPTPLDLKVIEGVNTSGLSFSVQSYAQAGGPQTDLDPTKATLSVIDLGAYLLSQFATVAEVKAALVDLPMVIEPVRVLGGLPMPFHYAVHDAQGQSLVIEFHHGQRTIYDNPVGVLTNEPQFSWHLTNLNNYTYLSNVEHSKAELMRFKAEQPGAGAAKIGLPETDSSVDRFIRGVYYAHFAEKQEDPDQAVEMVAPIMNNLDRPRGITIDPPELGSSHLQVEGQAMDRIPTEFTTWTSISDLERRRFYLRSHAGMSYVYIDLLAPSATGAFAARPLNQLFTPPADVSAQF